MALRFRVIPWAGPVLAALVWAGASLGGVRVLETGDRDVRILYEPGEMERCPVSGDGGAFDRLSFAECGVSGEPGAPMLPVRKVLVGMPAEGRARIEVVEAPVQEQEGYAVAPFPRMVEQERGGDVFHVEEYRRDAARYSEDRFQPEEPAQLGEPAFVRNQRVVPVYLYPVSYNPVSGRIRVRERVEVRVRFEGGERADGSAKAAGGGPSALDEDLYRSVVVNWEQARRWRTFGGAERLSAQDGPFAAGDWVKIHVEHDGMYRVSVQELKEAGIAVDGIESQSLRMHYGGGWELPISQEEARPELREIAMRVADGGDGVFDGQDALIFYGDATSRWAYVDGEGYARRYNALDARPKPEALKQNGKGYAYFPSHYTSRNCYWLTWTPGEPGKRMVRRDGSPSGEEVARPSCFRARIHEEVERFSDEGDSGLAWFWEVLGGSTRRYPFVVHTPAAGDTTTVIVGFSSGGELSFEVSLNETLVGTVAPAWSGPSALELKTNVELVDGIAYLWLKPKGKGEADLDWYEIEYGRRFEADQGKLTFDVPAGTGRASYRISEVEDGQNLVFRVTDPFNVEEFEGFVVENGELFFEDAGTSQTQPERYCVLSERQVSTVSAIERDRTSNLRGPHNGADFIILTHADFYEAAEELARWRRESPNTRDLETKVVDVQDVYDEFSWGLFDPIAIRDFLGYAFQWWSPSPTYVLLLGDGDYDLRNYSGSSPGIWIPPYEMNASATDDGFVCVSGEDTYPDLAVARIAVQSSQQADAVIQKIIEYERSPERGVWQNALLFVADDEVGGEPQDEPEHTRDTESIASHYAPQTFDQTKIYLTEYEKEGGYKPKASEAFLRAFNTGALVVNYLGHGNMDLLAHEHLFVASRDMSAVANGKRAPLVFLGTCNSGHFDHPRKESLIEQIARKPDGGAIAAISATRYVFAWPNADLDRCFFDKLFGPGQGTEPIGAALWRAKLDNSSQDNSSKFVLLGDPTLRLAAPELGVELAPVDSIRALDELEISGRVVGADGEPAAFSGQAHVRVFDSAYWVNHYTERTGYLIRYKLPGKVAFRGVFDVGEGAFDGYARIPKDISYNETNGRVSVFVWNGEGDGSGSVDGVFVGGTRPTSVTDEEGPSIRMGFRGQEAFSDGDYVAGTPVLAATLEDPSGINVTREIGHSIELTIDGDRNRVYDVTDYYVSMGGYQQGVLEYPLGGLPAGKHTLKLKVWDTFNNSSVDSARIGVAAAEDFALEAVLCYPNPMTTQTTFTYQLSHPAQITIEVYGLSGRLIERVGGAGQTGYNCDLNWVPRKRLANGVYLYRVTARRADGKRAEAVESLVVMR